MKSGYNNEYKSIYHYVEAEVAGLPLPAEVRGDEQHTVDEQLQSFTVHPCSL